MKGDGDGLYLSYRENFAVPIWRFRYRFQGKPRIMTMGSYSDLSLADALSTGQKLKPLKDNDIQLFLATFFPPHE